MILITGASEGIGFECARALLRRTDSSLLITGRSQAKLNQARGQLRPDAHDRLCTMACDQARAEQVDALIARLRAAPAISGAVLTVGVNPMYFEGPRRLDGLSSSTIEATVRTNCTHTVLLTAGLLERFRRQRSGILVWIGSQAAALGTPGAALYCATKSFLSGLARAVQHEYARYGIRAHVAHPGLVRTPRTAAFADAFATRHGVPVRAASDVARQIIDLYLDGDPDAVEVNLT